MKNARSVFAEDATVVAKTEYEKLEGFSPKELIGKKFDLLESKKVTVYDKFKKARVQKFVFTISMAGKTANLWASVTNHREAWSAGIEANQGLGGVTIVMNGREYCFAAA